MKICIKKVFCPVCQKLVRCREQMVGHQSQVSCLSGHALRVWNRVRWRVLRPTE